MPSRGSNYAHDPDKPIRTPAQAITAGLAAARRTLKREPDALTATQLRAKTDGELRRLQDVMPSPHPAAWTYWLTIHNTLTDAGHPTSHPALTHLDRRRGGTWREACTP